AMTGMLALYLDEELGVTEENIGYFYLFVGFVSVVMRGALLGRVVQRLGEVRVLRLGAVTLGAGMLGMSIASSLWEVAVAMFLIPTGTALLFPCTTSLVTRYAEPDSVGQTVGVQQAFGSTSRLLAPIWAGAVFQAVGSRTPFWIGGVLVLLVALFSLRLRPGEAPERKRERAPAATVADGGAPGEPPSPSHS
ncbi:MAG: MFS transporter, partial [Holophagales bacterium]|nr:MFS transporter [Holophagales bacterium]